MAAKKVKVIRSGLRAISREEITVAHQEWRKIAASLPKESITPKIESRIERMIRAKRQRRHLASNLKPGQKLHREDRRERLAMSRRKRARPTAEQMHAEVDRLCEGAPAQDTQATLRDLRR